MTGYAIALTLGCWFFAGAFFRQNRHDVGIAYFLSATVWVAAIGAFGVAGQALIAWALT